jgi:hypothetical protein
MIPVFPVSPFPLLPLIEFLSRPSGDQLNRFGDDTFIAIASYKKMNMLCEAAYYVKLISSNSVFCIHIYYLFNSLVHIIVALWQVG